MKTLLLLIAVTAIQTLPAHAEGALSFDTVKSGLQVIKCEASFTADPVVDIAQSASVIIQNPTFNVTCDNGTKQTLNLEASDSSADAICKIAGYRAGTMSKSLSVGNFGSTYESYDVALNSNRKLILSYNRTAYTLIDAVLCYK